MSKIAFIFPGQGAQYTKMAKDFAENNKYSNEIFNKASEALGYDMKELVFNEENEKKLNITEYTQPAILTATIAMLMAVLDKGISTPSFTAGLSLGEYSSHVLSGTFSFEDAVKLVRKRGKYMQEAVPVGEGTMAAIIGLDKEKLYDVLDEVKELGVCEAANFNCPGQIVISGSVKAVNKACEICKEKGAKRAITLSVSAPFHSSMLINAEKNLRKELENYKVGKMKYTVISNVNAKPVNIDNVKETLTKQVTHSVYWEDSVNYMKENGVDTFVEIGPGKTLANFMRRIDRKLKVYNISDIESLNKVYDEIGV